MAISKNMWLKGASQRLGGVVLYQAKGETRMRELAPSVSNPRTEAQMTQRVKLANLVNFYRTSRSWMQRAFEIKPQNNSDYNRFVSLNLTNNRIYLTKAEADAGACIVDAYRVTEGTLPSVETFESNGDYATNIYTGDLDEIEENTTVAAFATAVLQANAGLRPGDQLSFIRLTQQVNQNTGYPYVIVRAYEVLLDVSNTTPLANYLPWDYIAVTQLEGQNVFTIINNGLAGGFVLIVSRTIGSSIAVSSQYIVVSQNEAMINSHSSELAKQAAIDSYGQGEDVFLSSATAGTINSQTVPLALLSLTADGTDYTNGEIGPDLTAVSGKSGSLSFNADVPVGSHDVQLRQYTSLGGETQWSIVSGVASGNSINFTFPSTTTTGKFVGANVTIGGIRYAVTLDNGELG